MLSFKKGIPLAYAFDRRKRNIIYYDDTAEAIHGNFKFDKIERNMILDTLNLDIDDFDIIMKNMTDKDPPDFFTSRMKKKYLKIQDTVFDTKNRELDFLIQM